MAPGPFFLLILREAPSSALATGDWPLATNSALTPNH